MKEVKEFFSTISERITNPFVGSFIIAWIYCNWDIAVALIFYNSTTIVSTFDQNYLTFITERSGIIKSFLQPASYAAAYTFIIRYLISIIVESTYELFEKIKISILRIIQKDGWVRFSRLEQERKNFNTYRNNLAELFKEDNDTKEKFIILEKQIIEVIGERNHIAKENSTIKEYVEKHTSELDDFLKKLTSSPIMQDFNNRLAASILINQINSFKERDAQMRDSFINSIDVNMNISHNPADDE